MTRHAHTHMRTQKAPMDRNRCVSHLKLFFSLIWVNFTRVDYTRILLPPSQNKCLNFLLTLIQCYTKVKTFILGQRKYIAVKDSNTSSNLRGDCTSLSRTKSYVQHSIPCFFNFFVATPCFLSRP